MYLYKKPVCMWPRYNVLALSKRLSSSFSVLISTDGLASLGWYRVSHNDGGDRVMTPYIYTYMDIVRESVKSWLGVSGSMLGVSGHRLRAYMYILYNEMYRHVHVHGYCT